MKITKVQAEALTAFVVRIRPDWRPPGVMAALEKTAATADVHDVACALIRLAEDQSVKTPGLLPEPGPHWTRPDGSQPARRGDHTMRCPEHGQPYLRCDECAMTKAAPPPDDVKDEIRASLDRAKHTHHQRDAAKAEREAAR